MAAPLGSESTTFTLDNMGRFLCNTVQEALDSTGQTVGGRQRQFDTIIIGGGTFGGGARRAARALFYGREPAYRCQGHERLYLRTASHGTPQAAARWPESRRQQHRLQLCPAARTPRGSLSGSRRTAD